MDELLKLLSLLNSGGENVSLLFRGGKPPVSDVPPTAQTSQAPQASQTQVTSPTTTQQTQQTQQSQQIQQAIAGNTELDEQKIKELVEQINSLLLQRDASVKRVFDRYNANLDKYSRYIDYKTIIDSLINTGSLLGNLLSKKPDVVSAPEVPVSVVKSNLAQRLGDISNMQGRSLAAAIGVLGRNNMLELLPSVVSAYSAEAEKAKMSASEEASKTDMYNADLMARTAAQNAELQRNVAMYNDKKLSDIAMLMSQANEALMSNISKIISDYTQSKANIDEQRMLGDIMSKYSSSYDNSFNLLKSIFGLDDKDSYVSGSKPGTISDTENKNMLYNMFKSFLGK